MWLTSYKLWMNLLLVCKAELDRTHLMFASGSWPQYAKFIHFTGGLLANFITRELKQAFYLIFCIMCLDLVFCIPYPISLLYPTRPNHRHRKLVDLRSPYRRKLPWPHVLQHSRSMKHKPCILSFVSVVFKKRSVSSQLHTKVNV